MIDICSNSLENITVEQAMDIVLENSESFGTEKIDFTKTIKRILKEDIFADRDFPPFDRVSMDGIAIQFRTFQKGTRHFKIEGIQAAGTTQITLKNELGCIEAMTGAVLPKNTDVVIPYELIEIKDGFAEAKVDEVAHFQNIHTKGLDRKANQLLVAKNRLITSAEISVFATVGKTKVQVAKIPKIMIISTGDELVNPVEIPLEHQIRRSNVFALKALLEEHGIPSDQLHLKDDKENLKIKIAEVIEAYDVCIFSGAVSKGKFDFLPEVLNELKVERKFHRVNQRPGKPFWFGKKENKTFFAFPGNPVSTYVSCIKYFLPWFQKSMGIPFQNEKTAILGQDFSFKPSLTYFLQVKTSQNNGMLHAKPISGNGSGDLANLTDCDAFLELPPSRVDFKEGEIFPVHFYR